MGLHEDLERRFAADRITGALERTRAAVDRQTRVIESLNRPADDRPRLPGVVILVGVLALVLLLPVVLQLPNRLWHPFGRALHRTGAALEWAGNVAIWLGLLWLVTWPLRRWWRRRPMMPTTRPSR